MTVEEIILVVAVIACIVASAAIVYDVTHKE